MKLRTGWPTQVKALLKKDLQILRRSKLSICICVLAAMIGVLMLIGTERALKSNPIKWSEKWNTVGATPSEPLNTLSKCHSYGYNINTKRYLRIPDPCVTVVFAPNTSAEAVSAITKMSAALGLQMGKDVIGFENHDNLIRNLFDDNGGVEFGVTFYNVKPSVPTEYYYSEYQVGTVDEIHTNSLPDILGYEIEYNNTLESAYLQDPDSGAFSPIRSDISTRMLTLQKALAQGIIRTRQEAVGKAPNFKLDADLRPFAVAGVNSFSQYMTFYSSGISDAQIDTASSGAVLVIGCFSLCLIVLASIVSEKEKKMLAVLRLIGLHESAFWVSKAIAMVPVAVVSSILSEIIGRVANVRVFVGSSVGIPSTLLGAYSLALIGQGCFLASLVGRSRWAAVLGFFSFAFALLFQSVFPLLFSKWGFYIVYKHGASWFQKLLTHTLPAFHFGKIFQDMLEGTALVVNDATGVATRRYFSWSDFSSRKILIDESFSSNSEWRYVGIPSAGFNTWLLFVDFLTLVSLSIFFSHILPSDVFGTKLPIYFFLKPSYWGFFKRKDFVDGDVVGEAMQKSLIEKSVQMVKMSKSFKTATALSEVSLEMENRKIFCLLGKNGSGKTTMCRILSGLMPPTHGEAFVHGLSVRNDTAAIRASTGMCFQENLLWDDLSGRAHLELFCAFKGIPADQIKAQTDEALKDVDLDGEAADRVASSYSGGMKRRLCVAMSSVGAPKVIFLDEPTTGMDPLSRRRAWAMIQRLKEKSVVLVTTHSMEEADALGDSVGILSNGRLRAFGSPLFLKNRYGTGYQLKLQSRTMECLPDLQSLVEKMIPSSDILSQSATTLNVGVPKKFLRRVSPFFREAHHRNLISAWGFSLSTLEEVYLRLTPTNELNKELEFLDNTEKLCVVCGVNPVTDSVVLFTAKKTRLEIPGHLCNQCVGKSEIADTADAQEGPESAAENFPEIYLPSFDTPTPPPPLQPPPPTEERPRVQRKRMDLDGSNLTLQQAWAIFAKSGEMQKRQRKYSLCVLLLTLLLLLAIIIVTLETRNSYTEQTLHLVTDRPFAVCRSYYGPSSYYSSMYGDSEPCDPQSAQIWYSRMFQKSWLDSVASDYSPSWYRAYNGEPEYFSSQYPSTFQAALFLGNQSSNVNNIWLSYSPAADPLILPSNHEGGPFLHYSSFQSSLKMDQTFFEFQKYIQTHPANPRCNPTPTGGSYSGDAAATAEYAINHVPSLGLSFEKNDVLKGSVDLTMTLPLPPLGYPYKQLLSTDCYPFDLQIGHDYYYAQGESNVVDLGPLNVIANSLLRQHADPKFTLTFGLGSLPTFYFPAEGVTMSAYILTSCILIPIIVMLPLPTLTMQIVVERQTGLVHLLKMGGMRRAAYFLGTYAWATFLNFFFFAFVVIVGMALNIGYFQSYPSYFFAQAALWGNSQAAMSIFIGSVSFNEKIASTVSYFVMFVIVIVVSAVNVVLVFPTWPSVFGLFPPLGFVISMQQLITGQTDSLALNFFLQLVGALMFLGGGVYLHQAMPGSYGNSDALFCLPKIKKILTPNAPRPSIPLTESQLEGGERSQADEDVIAEYDATMRPAADSAPVCIRNVVKKYTGKATNSLDHLTLHVKKNETFGLLGPNGSGKTTLLDILTGVKSLTSGEAAVAGQDVVANIDGVHRSVGVCPQYEILWQDLTVKQTLVLFARIKGVPPSHLTARVRSIAEKIDLDGDSFDTVVSSLSGGQKRRLGLGMALAGEPEVLLLDEPSTGLDPEAKNAVWKVIESLKADKAIILTTHSMAEADALSDRIGIMTLGQLRCVGTPMSLKQKYGSGFTLSFQLESGLRAGGLHDALTTKICPEARRIKDDDESQAYVLPRTIGDLWGVFDAIERSKKALGIREWALSQTTLEDVFVKIAEENTGDDSIDY